MRGIGRVPPPFSSGKRVLAASSHFSTFGGPGGRGRGRGRGSSPAAPPRFVDDSDAVVDDAPLPSPGLGHGRGTPVPSSPVLPSFSSWMSGPTSSTGRGRGRDSTSPQPDLDPTSSLSKKPIFFRRDTDSVQQQVQFVDPEVSRVALPQGIAGGLTGAGRGKALQPPGAEPHPQEENRHLRRRPANTVQRRGGIGGPGSSQRREEAVRRAVEILGRGGESGRGRGGRGMRGRTGVRGQGFRGRGGRGRAGRPGDADDDFATGLYLGDNADGERLMTRLGEEKMNTLNEAFEEMSWRVLPSPLDDAYLDAMHTNNLIEFEPEYHMADFESNPDIDDTPPIPLRDALEKMKPFLMEYEGIQSQEEWEGIIEELMERVPVFQELIDYYSGPDRVTAKHQQQELERLAKTVREDAPASVKRFTERAMLSLQSNPGMRWEKKFKFMDKLVREASEPY